MIHDLDDTIAELLHTRALPGSTLAGAAVSFELPDATWRGQLSGLTVNCYLYDVHENVAMRTEQPLIVRSADKTKAARVRPPVRIDCTYCITAWSIAASGAAHEEHKLLSEVLAVLLNNPSMPSDVLQGGLVSQVPPYPTVIASREGTAKTHPEFWHALDQKLKPSLNYVVTLAMLLDGVPTPTNEVVAGVTRNGEVEPKLGLAVEQES